MQLYLNATSPYARVARICLYEKQLIERTELCWCDPWASDSDLLQITPLSRIPTLVTDEGEVLTESLLIALYLDAQGEGESLLPQAALAETLAFAGLGHGLMEAAFNVVIGRKHGGHEVDTTLLGSRRLKAIERTLVTLNAHPSVLAGNAERTLGAIVVAVALAYISFRLPAFDWQNRFPTLHAWQSQVVESESFALTAFE
ncbi:MULTISPECIES: glutathione S-transferase family protein [unclassified Halomonas]|uniref:glutathione S-transferase family protein n=1 Tax=unclassified Halomonas TaxID=2609666 RepID=UPI0006DB68AA|nr:MULTISPECIES: glutathione S-transferase family protein [unclassified Halomonas]KPQ21822.1 MAG: Glutathione S-transferase [Halomonas sp. HL-93]SBR45083.1 glutathione S-transferase [Halomonas sp. HL-93]SNY97724.1 glutathione S-transferase [Halomonas sp. hl-4]